MSDERRMKKLKLNKDGKRYLEYEVRAGKDAWDLYTVTCTAAPTQGLTDAVQALIPYVVEMCELPDADLERVTVTGITWSYCGDEGDILGATLTATKRLKYSNSPLNLNTPHKFADYPSGQDVGDENQLLPDGCETALWTVSDACLRFLDGERAPSDQLDLFDQPADAAPDLTQQLAAFEDLRRALGAGDTDQAMAVIERMAAWPEGVLEHLERSVDFAGMLAEKSTLELTQARYLAFETNQPRLATVIDAELNRRKAAVHQEARDLIARTDADLTCSMEQMGAAAG